MIQKALDEVATIIAGQSPASSTYNTKGDGLPFFQGKTDFQDKYPNIRMWCNSKKRKEAKSGDILMSVRAPVGSVNICDTRSIIGRGLSAIRVKPELNNEYLYYFLKAHEKQIASLGTGSTFKAITQATLKKIKIPLPSIDDQALIVHLLGKVEKLIIQRKRHLNQLDDLLKSVFLDMFGDPVNNDKNHKLSPLSNFITHLTSGGRGWAKYYTSSGKRFIRSLDVQMNSIGSDEVVYVTPPENKETERTKVLAGDVLLTITGSKIGRVCFVPNDFEEAHISQHVAIIRTSGINPVYLSFYLSMPNCGQRIIGKNQYGQAKPGLNFKQINNFEILEPDQKLQNHFANLFHKTESVKGIYQESLMELEHLYGVLSQQAFQGKLDLSDVAIPAFEDSSVIDNSSQEQENSWLSAFDEILKKPTELNYQYLTPHFNTYLDTLGETAFNLEACASFMQDTIVGLEPEYPDHLNLHEYETTFKKLTFDALSDGRLRQAYDEDSKCILLFKSVIKEP